MHMSIKRKNRKEDSAPAPVAQQLSSGTSDKHRTPLFILISDILPDSSFRPAYAKGTRYVE
jgi:hypothetical protein